VVLDPGVASADSHEGPRPVVLTSERQVTRLSLVDFPTPVQPIDRLRVPKAFNPRSPQSRRDLAAALRSRVTDEHGGRPHPKRGRAAAADDDEIARLRQAIRAHPCHGCDEREDHARWAERYYRLARETRQLEERVESRTNTIARTFDRVCGLLESLGYLDGDEVTADGERLARLYTELDLLAAECVRDGLWSGLTPPELAACVSALAYESRQQDDASAPRLPTGAVREVLAETVRTWARLDQVEKDHGLAFLREPDLGFAQVAYRWAAGSPLESVLREADLPAGDFVRWTKQLIDLLGQVGQAAGERDAELRRTADAAVDALRRGVVAYSSVG
jgi:ATP-dependent RNA helicase HelY